MAFNAVMVYPGQYGLPVLIGTLRGRLGGLYKYVHRTAVYSVD